MGDGVDDAVDLLGLGLVKRPEGVLQNKGLPYHLEGDVGDPAHLFGKRQTYLLFLPLVSKTPYLQKVNIVKANITYRQRDSLPSVFVENCLATWRGSQPQGLVGHEHLT